MPGKKNIVADALSRKTSDPGSIGNEAELDDFVDCELNYIRVGARSITTDAPEALLDDNYSDKSEAYAQWLTTMRRPEHLSPKEFTAFKREVMKHIVREGHLFRKQGNHTPLRRVVDSESL